MRRVLEAHEKKLTVVATAGLILVLIGRVYDLIPLPEGLPAVKVLTATALLVYLASARIVRPSFQASHVGRLFWAFIAMCFVSIVFSMWRGTTFGMLTTWIAALIVIVLLVFRTSGRLETLETYVRALVWSGVALTIGGFLARGTGRVEFGSMYDPNDLAFVLIAVLPLTLALWRLTSGLRALIWAGLAAGSVWIILLTQSRGGLIGLLMVMAYLAATGAWRARFEARFRLARVFAGFAIFTMLAVPTWFALPPDAQERFATILNPTEDYNYTAQREGRWYVWSRGIETLVERPWGVGAGAYSAAEMARSGYWRTAHNSLLQVAVELGVIGFLIYFGLFLRSWRVLGRIMTAEGAQPGAAEPPPDRWRIYAQHLRASLLGILGAGFFISMGYSSVVFAVFAVVAALEARFVPRQVAARGRRRAGVAARAPAAALPEPMARR